VCVLIYAGVSWIAIKFAAAKGIGMDGANQRSS